MRAAISCTASRTRFDHGTPPRSMMLLFRAAPPPICDTPRERDLGFAGGGGVCRFNLPLVNGGWLQWVKLGYEPRAMDAWRKDFFSPSPPPRRFGDRQWCSISAVSDCRVFEKRGALFERVSGFGGEGGGDFRVGFSSGLVVFAFREYVEVLDMVYI